MRGVPATLGPGGEVPLDWAGVAGRDHPPSGLQASGSPRPGRASPRNQVHGGRRSGPPAAPSGPEPRRPCVVFLVFLCCGFGREGCVQMCVSRVSPVFFHLGHLLEELVFGLRLRHIFC